MTAGTTKRGGKRKGAGRPLAPHVTARVKVPRELWAALEARAQAHGRSAEQEAARLLALACPVPLLPTPAPESKPTPPPLPAFDMMF